MQYLMAIDAGTGSIRAVIFDSNGKQVSASRQEWTHIEEEGVPDSMTFDTEHNWGLVAACIRDALHQAELQGSDIAAVSAASMHEGIVLYNKKGEALWGVANVDARAAEEVKQFKEQYPGIEEAFYTQSGQAFALGALPRILWPKNHRPEMYKRTASLSMTGDWILAKFSGVIVTDPSNGGTTGIFSLKERSWVPEMAEKIGAKKHIFPPVLEPGTVPGTVTENAAGETGLSTATKVVMGGGDVQIGSTGFGVIKEGQVAILGGSFWQQVVNIKSDTPRKIWVSASIPTLFRASCRRKGSLFSAGWSCAGLGMPSVTSRSWKPRKAAGIPTRSSKRKPRPYLSAHTASCRSSPTA